LTPEQRSENWPKEPGKADLWPEFGAVGRIAGRTRFFSLRSENAAGT
jgi:hypothetical protein